MKKSFVMFTDKYEAVKLLTMEQRGVLLTAIFAHASGEELPDMDDVTRVLYTVIQGGMDACAEKYEATCERRRQAGQKGGLAKASNAKQCLANPSNAKHNDTDTDTETETETDTDTETETETDTETETNTDIPKGIYKKAGKPAKHKYGEYQHVLLTDDEREKLADEYGEETLTKCIRKLDEYIEETGKRYKSHYLTIRRWVVDAVRRNAQKRGSNIFLDMMEDEGT